MLLTIRCAVPEDEPSVVELWRACDLVASYNDPAADFRFAIAGACSGRAALRRMALQIHDRIR
jgi:hypothetical protein